MNRRGFSLLEVLIASVILVSVLLGVYMILFACQGLYEKEVPLRATQHDMQMAMEDLIEEVRESSEAFVYPRIAGDTDYEITDDNTGGPDGFFLEDSGAGAIPSTILLFPSARDATGAFLTRQTGEDDLIQLEPSWQKLVLYAPYYDSGADRGELRRYEVEPMPLGMTTGAPPTVNIAEDTITVNGTAIPRDSGRSVLVWLLHFRYQRNPSGVGGEVRIAARGVRSVTLQTETDMGSGTKARN